MTVAARFLCLVMFCLSATAAGAAPFSGAGWNTWDIGRTSGFIFMPGGAGVELRLLDPQTGALLPRASLNDAERFGAHAPDGSYIEARYHQESVRYEVEFASRGKEAVIHIRPLVQSPYLLLAEVFFPFGRSGAVNRHGSTLLIAVKGQSFTVSSPNPEKTGSKSPSPQGMSWDLTADRWISIGPNPQPLPTEEACRHLVRNAREAYENARVRSDGFLADGAQAALDAVSWNLVWSSRADAPVTTVAREWPVNSGIQWGGYIQGGWDAVFQSLIANAQSAGMAEASLQGLLADITPGGYVPNLGTGWGTTEDRSHPPLAAYALLKFYKTHGRRPILEQTFPKLLRWHKWWFTARDGNRDGLLEWGSNPVDTASVRYFWQHMLDSLKPFFRRTFGVETPWLNESNTMGNKAASTFESGVDDHPMWREAAYNTQTHTMELDDVGLNSLYALDAWTLAQIAGILGRRGEQQAMDREFGELRERINRDLWDDGDGVYRNRHWDGHLDPHLSPSNFYPMIAGVATPEQATRAIEGYLRNPAKFWTTYVIPSSPKDEPSYQKGGHDAGRDQHVMAPLNYLVYEGLKRSGQDQVAAAVASSGATLFLREWQAKSHIHEVYSAFTGSGDGTISSQYYAWGGLLPLIQMEEAIDVEPWGDGIRIGSLSSETMSIRNLPVGPDTYDVYLGPGVRLVRNGKLVLTSDAPIVMRNLNFSERGVRFNPTVLKDVHVVIYDFRAGERIRLLPEQRILPVASGRVEFQVRKADKSVEVVREDAPRR